MYKVMIVDDEPLIREGLRTLIPWEQLGFHIVDVAKDGKDAIAKYKQYKLDLMIVDIRMPGMDGLQVIETIRKSDPSIHFLILSGYADFDYARRAIVCNVDGYIVKPVDEDEMIEDLTKVKASLDADKGFELKQHVQEAWCSDYRLKLSGEQDNAMEPYSHPLMVEKLFYAMDIGNKSAVQSILQQAIHQMVVEEQSEQIMKTNCVQLLTAVMNKLSSSHPNLKPMIDEVIKDNVDIYQQASVTELQTFLEELVKPFLDHLATSNNDTILKQMLDLIQRNYSHPLKLETLAETFNYNSAYLGRLFKNYTGEHFNTYLDKVRIEEAKRLLLQNVKVYQVAARIGYPNVDYFYSKFRRYVGVSPSEYRRTSED